ncbi:hypothetical protein, partial [Pseudomonas sp. AH2 (2023)]
CTVESVDGAPTFDGAYRTGASAVWKLRVNKCLKPAYSSIKADIFEISVKYFLSERLTPDLPEKEGLISDLP